MGTPDRSDAARLLHPSRSLFNPTSTTTVTVNVYSPPLGELEDHGRGPHDSRDHQHDREHGQDHGATPPSQD